MGLIHFLGLGGACALVFANGANDISKSSATLVGSGEAGYKKAVLVVSLAAAAGTVLWPWPNPWLIK